MKFKDVMGNQGSVVLEMDKGTLQDALAAVCAQCGRGLEDLLFDPTSKGVKGSNMILINGQSFLNLRDRLGHSLKDGDEIALLPVMTGG